MNRYFFEDLFVLEMANNHWGNVESGLKIISDFSKIVRFNNVRAAIKLQLRDVDSFIHKDFRNRTDIRYIKKTLDTQLIEGRHRDPGRPPFARAAASPAPTPFDEKSVDLCMELGVQILKMASSDLNDWFLLEKIAKMPQAGDRLDRGLVSEGHGRPGHVLR